MNTWQTRGYHSGAPIVADAAPNTTAPAAARLFDTEAGQSSLLVLLVDGTSATATVWCYDSIGKLWVQVDQAACTAGTAARMTCTALASTFVQLTNVVGNPTVCRIFPGTEGASDAMEAKLDTLNTTTGTVKTSVDAVNTNLTSGQAHTDSGAIATAVGLVDAAVDLCTVAVNAVTSAITGTLTSAVNAIATAVGLTQTASSCVAITLHDSNPVAATTKGVYCTVGGNAVVSFTGDAGTVTLPVLAATWYPFNIDLMTTASTATLYALR